MNPREDRHLVLAAIEDGVRAMSIRQLGGYSESLGVRTTLLFLVKPPGSFTAPIVFTAREVAEIASFLKRENVTHLGFSLMTGTLRPVAELVAALRAAGYGGAVLAGGIHVELRPEESLFEGADSAVQGPGEIPLKMILEGADPAVIPGLVWRDGNAKVRVNRIVPDQALDMDERPFPLWRLKQDVILANGRLRRLSGKLHKTFAGWHGTYYDCMTSLGCLYRCAYCCQTHRGAVRRASVDRVIREIQHVRANMPFIEGVNLQDDSFFSGAEDWVEEFSMRLKTEVGMPFIARMIPRMVTPERLDLMVKGGLVYVTMGLEGSDRINKTLYHRPETQKTFLAAAKAVLDRGLILSVDLIVDNPYETEADLREVARTLNQLPRPNWWVVSLSLTPFPGTPLYDRCKKDGRLLSFATDAYDSMLVPSRPGGYQTPDFWRKLNGQLLPLIAPGIGAKLIAAGPENPAAIAAADRLLRSLLRVRRITNWLRDRTPVVHAVLFRTLRMVSKRKDLPKIMTFR